MTNRNIILVLLITTLASACVKKVPLISSADTIDEIELREEDSLLNVNLSDHHNNYLVFHDLDVSKILKNYLDTADVTSFIPDTYINQELEDEIHTFYKANNYTLSWNKGKKLNRDAQYVVTKLYRASEEGLSPEDYEVDKLSQLKDSVFKDRRHINIFQLMALDVKLTAALLTYAWHLENGKIDPGEENWRWAFEAPHNTVALELSQTLPHNNLKQTIDQLLPGHRQYELLKDALSSLKILEKRGGWAILPSDLDLDPGDSSRFVPLLRERLVTSGDHKKIWKRKFDNHVYDPQLVAAVKAFQGRHGLEKDGKIGPNTLAALNMTVEEKINKIIVNLERLRWLPDSMASDHLLINLPEFKLKVVRNDKPVWEMKIITGDSYEHATPIFHDKIEYLVFRPTWGVPNSIVRKEILPVARKDPGYLTRNGYQVYVSGKEGAVDPHSVNYDNPGNIRIVQKSGPTNALGLVKFIMPNRFNIYLHDTPADYLFNRNERDFSHGCIRLEKPQHLAFYLLDKNQDKKWSEEEVEEYMGKDYPTTIWLDQPEPVYMLYQTAFVDEKGALNFRKDIYEHDNDQFQLIAEKK